jgi:hypothetical protein
VIHQQYPRAALFSMKTSAAYFSSNFGRPTHFIQALYQAFATMPGA